jgi:hypothetical protein
MSSVIHSSLSIGLVVLWWISFQLFTARPAHGNAINFPNRVSPTADTLLVLMFVIVMCHSHTPQARSFEVTKDANDEWKDVLYYFSKILVLSSVSFRHTVR